MMARFKIFHNGEHINTIVGKRAFVDAYCISTGYTYEEEAATALNTPVLNPSPESPDPQTDTDELMVDLAYRVTLLELGLTDTGAEEVI